MRRSTSKLYHLSYLTVDEVRLKVLLGFVGVGFVGITVSGVVIAGAVAGGKDVVVVGGLVVPGKADTEATLVKALRFISSRISRSCGA